MNRLSILLAGTLLGVGSCAVWGQSPAPQQEAPAQAPPSTTIRSNAQEVVLDMVFRDKKGKTVRDIRP